jgi:hypothetical protein
MSNQYTGSAFTITINSVLMDQVLDVQPPQCEVGTVEYKPLGQQWVGRLPAMSDGGETTFSAILDPASTTYAGLMALVGAPLVVPILIKHTASSKEWVYDGILTNLDPSDQDNETLCVYEGTLVASGAVLISAAS